MSAGQRSTMVVGLGSPNGDDQAGWRVIDLLLARVGNVCQLRYAKVPHELIDWIGDIDVLHVIDACETNDDRSAVSQYRVSVDDHDVTLLNNQNRRTATLPRLRSNSSHQMDFGSVVQLARQLQRLPDCVTIWTIPGREFGPSETVHPDCEAQIAKCAENIARELADAS